MYAHLVSAAQHVAPTALLEGRGTHAQGSLTSLPLALSRWERLSFKERGTALIFALVMLLLLTLLGITAVTTSSLQEKMAGNMRDQYMAQQASDSILHDGQALIINQTARPIPSCPPDPIARIWDSGCLPASTLAGIANWWLTATDAWWTTAANAFTSSVATVHTSQEPRYVVERIEQAPIHAEIGKDKKVYRFYYRTTGWSVGATDYSRGLIQNVFSKRSDTYLD